MARIVKKPDIRRAEIIQAARQLFLSKDFAKTTMQDVMKHLDIAKGTIYHYFPSKDALLDAVVVTMVAERIAIMEAYLEETEGNALEKITKLVELGRMGEDNPDLLASLHTPSNAAIHLRILAESIALLAPLYEKIIRQGCQEGIFHTETPLECAEFILAGLQFLSDVGIYSWREATLKRRRLAFPRIIEQQLRAPENSFAFLSNLI